MLSYLPSGCGKNALHPQLCADIVMWHLRRSGLSADDSAIAMQKSAFEAFSGVSGRFRVASGDPVRCHTSAGSAERQQNAITDISRKSVSLRVCGEAECGKVLICAQGRRNTGRSGPNQATGRISLFCNPFARILRRTERIAFIPRTSAMRQPALPTHCTS